MPVDLGETASRVGETSQDAGRGTCTEVKKCLKMSGGPRDDLVVYGMLEDETFLREYVNIVRNLRRENKIPDLSRVLLYRVYRIRGSHFGAHESIVLNHGQLYFTVELGFKVMLDGTKRIYPITNAYSGPLSKLEFCGEVQMCGDELLGRAVALMQKFGTYYKCLNNCQNFCNAYLNDIGLGQSTQLTDAEKGFACGAVVAGIGYLLVTLLSGDRNRNRRTSGDGAVSREEVGEPACG